MAGSPDHDADRRVRLAALTPREPAEPLDEFARRPMPPRLAIIVGAEGPGLTPSIEVNRGSSPAHPDRAGRGFAESGGRNRHRARAGGAEPARSRYTRRSEGNPDVDHVAAIPVEYASERKIRERNKLYYRFNHWPIWIFVFFIAPGSADVRLVRTRIRLPDGALARGRHDRHRHRRPARADCQGSSRSRTSSASPKIGRTRSTVASVTRLRGAKRSRSRFSISPDWSSRSSPASGT